MQLHDTIAAFAVVIGLIGIIVPVLPGMVLQAIAVVLWAFEESSVTGWAVALVVIVITTLTTVLKYLYPGRRLREAGIPLSVTFIALVVGVVGLFVIPIIGGPIGFVLAIYLFERARLGREQAWPSTKRALSALAASYGIELAGGFVITALFLAAVILL